MLIASKRIHNDIQEYELSSDRKIPYSFYYIIKIEFYLDQPETSIFDLKIDQNSPKIFEDTNLEVCIKHILKTRQPPPLISYTNRSDTKIDLYLLYSCLDSGSHYKNGSHHLICSEISSCLSRKYDCLVLCNIVELKTRTEVYAYFQYKIYEHVKNIIVKLSNSKISTKESINLTHYELINELKERGNVVWENVDPSVRFGIFYKIIRRLKAKKGDSVDFLTMSEMIDFRDIRKYERYFFE